MPLAKSLVKMLIWIAEIGITPGMRHEEAKHIRILNIFIVGGLSAVVIGGVYWLINSDSYWQCLLFGVMIICSLAVYYFNYQGHYKAARIYGILIYCLLFGIQSLFTGNQLQDYHYYVLLVAAAIIVFPKNERPTMVIMILISLLSMFVIMYLGTHIEPAFFMTEKNLKTTNMIIWYTVIFIMIMDLLVGRYFMDRAEERLQEENQKVVRLSDKLKSYLPNQFVDSLAAGARASAVDYRRRRLTIFFSDVKGFTEWVDRLYPEEVRAILNQYLTEMSRIAIEYGGTIDKFIGDAIMIFFGDPEFTSDRDHALRCVKMALAMQKKMAVLRQEWEAKGFKDPLHIRIGINTGEATVGSFGSKDRLSYTALGSAVNMAQRLETACTPDRITVSRSTYDLIREEIPCQGKGEVKVKGFSDPVPIYEVE